MKLLLKDQALKHLAKIPLRDRKKIEKKLLSLEKDPLAGKELRGELSGIRSLRAWPLRIIYVFDPKAQTVEILDVDYRGDVYR